MNGKEIDVQEIIEAAVLAAHEAGIKGMDEKVQAAINLALPLGIKIGAEIGSKIGAEIGAKTAIEAAERERESYSGSSTTGNTIIQSSSSAITGGSRNIMRTPYLTATAQERLMKVLRVSCGAWGGTPTKKYSWRAFRRTTLRPKS